MKRTLATVAILVIIAFCLTLALASAASATPDVTVTPATGGEAISADTFETATDTPLGSIVIVEGASGDIGTGTIILDVPTGFEFCLDPQPDVAVTGTGELDATFTSVTTTQITITVTTASTTATNTLTIGGSMHIGVRPTQGTPLASGNIVMDAASTSTIDGVTPGATNFGTLTEVAGDHDAYTVVAASPQTAGTAFAVTITAVDQYGNTVTGIDGTLNAYIFTFSGPTNAPNGTEPTYPSPPAVFSDGVWTPDVTLVKAETVALTVTDDQVSPMSGTSSDLTVNVASLEVEAPDTVMAGDAFNVELTAEDAYGNISAETQSITFTSTATASPDTSEPTIPSPQDITFIAGVGTAEGFILVNAGETPTITATKDAVSGMSDTISVNPRAASKLGVSGITDPIVAGRDSDVTVTALDLYGNTDTSYTGTITLTSSDSQALLPALYTFGAGDNGVKTFTDGVTLKTVGEQTVTAKDTATASITGSQTDITVIAADGDDGGNGTPTPTPTPTGPTIAFIPTSFSFTATEGGDNPASNTLNIWNSGTGTLTWLLADNAAWLTLTPTGGSSTGVADKDSVTLSVDISGMSAGSNSATITISASGATNTPRTVAVVLTISAPATPSTTGTVGTTESWVETDDGKIILHFRAGSFASETNVSIALKTIHGDAPEDFTLGGTCFSITAGAELLRSIDVCVRYSDADVAAADGDPGKLRLAVYYETEGETEGETESGWDALSTSIDERTRTACARVDHLSDFAILAGPGPPGFFSADWWTVWWHITPFAVGLIIVIAVAIWLWSRYKYYY